MCIVIAWRCRNAQPVNEFNMHKFVKLHKNSHHITSSIVQTKPNFKSFNICHSDLNGKDG